MNKTTISIPETTTAQSPNKETAFSVKDLLIEIGCEELPAKPLKKTQDNFGEALSKAFTLAELSFESIEAYATPRRLAFFVKRLATEQPTRTITKRGPAKQAAFDEKGNPSKAALGFAESCGVSIESLNTLETDKGSWLVYEQQITGKSAKSLIPEILQKILNTLPLGRRMRWGDNVYSFSRPIHWCLLLLDQKPIEVELFGIKSSNKTYGHRFHHPKAITIATPKDYKSTLKAGLVIADFKERRDLIINEIKHLTEPLNYHPILNEALLDEVTGLVEWPEVMIGEFEKTFLEIPREALITSMQTHQKCFAIADSAEESNLLPKFIIVSNIQSKHPEKVKAGNERVMRARLADAVFYYRTDKNIPLRERQEGLKHIVFQAGLGTLWDKTKRIAHLSMKIAKEIHADPIYTERAALLCKTDLLTQMVGEFPELQGIMGRYYALNDSEPKQVATAIEEHYYPRFAQDRLPETKEGSAIALADRIDTLVALFKIGHRPTGDKDPFGLRRQAAGVLRILVENELGLDLQELLQAASAHFPEVKSNKNDHESEIIGTSITTFPNKTVVKDNSTPFFMVTEVLDFCFERARAWYVEKGIPAEVFEAVRQTQPTKPLDFDRRINAVNFFITLPEAEALTAANKRVYNILFKGDKADQILHILMKKDNTDYEPVSKELLVEEAEIKLAKALSAKEKELIPFLETQDYLNALKALVTLKEPIDLFFDKVMVMVEDEKLRNNRLRLLNHVRKLFIQIADISLL